MSRTVTYPAGTDAPPKSPSGAAARAAAMLEHPVLAIAVTDEGRIRETNAAWKSLFALPSDVSVESHVATLFANVHGADRFERLLQSQLVGPGGAIGSNAIAEHTLVRRDGTSFLAEIVIWLLDLGGADRPLAANAIWQVRDITEERALRRELRDLEDYHRELSRHQWDVTFVIDRKGRISYASPAVEETLGHRVNKILGESFTKLLAPAHAAAAGQWLRGASTTKRGAPAVDPFALHILDDRGSERVLSCRASDCFDIPRIAGMVIHGRELVVAAPVAIAPSQDRFGDSLRARLIELAALPSEASEARIAALVAAAREALAAEVAFYRPVGADAQPIVAPSGRASVASADAIDDRTSRVVDDVATDPSIDDTRRAAFDDAQVAASIEVPVLADGVVRGRLFVGSGSARRWRDAEVDFVLGVALSIASAVVPPPAPVATRDAVDPLTGLPEREAAREWLERRVGNLASSGSLTLLSVDLDRLQDVNDRHGYDAGDAVLERSARTLTEVFGKGGYVARVSGDAFVVVLANAGVKAVDETVAMLLDRIHDTATDGGATRIQASVGVARLPGDATDATTLWAHADLARREAKRRGRGQAFAFHPRLAAAARVEKALDVEIADALARNEFVLFYQPQIALATGKVMGLEALLRWQHPTRGLLLPSVFIEAAVERGLADAITKSAVAKVCEQIATWRRGGDFPELPVGVNVAGNQFHDRRLPALVASALMRSGLPARLLVLELTEQSLVGDDPDTERVVKELDRLGVRTAVGGFALGHGALKQLRQLRVAQIKLDRGFVDDVPVDESSRVVVRTVIDIARRLKCQVIAEGVETRAQFEQLRALGCEAGQGFYFGAPLSPDEIRAFVENNLKNPIH